MTDEQIDRLAQVIWAASPKSLLAPDILEQCHIQYRTLYRSIARAVIEAMPEWTAE